MKRKHAKEAEVSDANEAAADLGPSDDPSEMMLEVEEGGDGGRPEAPVTTANDATEALERTLEETRDQLLRARAEFENYRKRVARDSERMRKLAAEHIIKDLLPVADNFERALEHAASDPSSLMEGVAMVYKQFTDVLARHGVEPIPAVGEAFDPNVHEALSRVPSKEHAEDQVAHEYQRGYRLGDMVLRPSKVVISSGAEDRNAKSPESIEE